MRNNSIFDKVHQSVVEDYNDKLFKIKLDDEEMDFAIDNNGPKTCRNQSKPALSASTIMDNIEKYRGDLSRRS